MKNEPEKISAAAPEFPNPKSATPVHLTTPPDNPPPAATNAPSTEPAPVAPKSNEGGSRFTLHASRFTPSIAPPPPVPWPEPVDGQALLDELRRTFTRFVVLPKFAPETLALWTLHTYSFQLGDVGAYLGILSPVKRCGKSTLLSVLNKLVHRPVLAANISFKAFFHVIEQTSPTLLIDETDAFLPANDELRGILNAGLNRDAAFVIRFAQPADLLPPEPQNPAAPPATSHVPGTDHGSPISHPAPVAPKSDEGGPRSRRAKAARRRATSPSLARFSCWCPKALAAIGRLPDTVADRSIVVAMQRKTANEKCERLRLLQPANLTRQCARFVLDHQNEIAAAQPEFPPALNDRAADLWEPLLVLADLAGGPWPNLARQAALALSSTAEALDSGGPIESLFSDILRCFLYTAARRMFSRKLVEGLGTMPPRPWHDLLKGKAVSELWVAKILRPYGIHPQCMRIHDCVGKGYAAEDFAEIFRRYLPASDIEAIQAEAQAILKRLPPSSNPAQAGAGLH